MAVGIAPVGAMADAGSVRAQLNEALPLIQVDRVYEEYSIYGYEVGVLVIDNFDDRTCIDRPHGEAVAEIIERVAPSANIYFFNVGVLDPVTCQTLPAQKILQGLFAAVLFAESRGISVINMSFGVPDTNLCNKRDRLENEFLEELSDSGIILVAAAGNDGKTNSINHPACLDNVISVGAVYDQDGAFTPACDEFGIVDWLTCFSNRSAFLDVVAPGSAIGTFANPDFDGTSAASPIVTGVIALLLEANPRLTSDEIVEIFEETGDPAFDPVNQITFARINAYEAVREVLLREGIIQPEPPRPGLGLSGLAVLDFYDINDSRSIEDEELFFAVDDWIVENITDREFFIVLDAWILDLNIRQSNEAAASRLPSPRAHTSQDVMMSAKIYTLTGKLVHNVGCSVNSSQRLYRVLEQKNLNNGIYVLELLDCLTGERKIRPIARIW